MNKQTPLNTIASAQTTSRGRRLMMAGATAAIAVSYTHLTLPTTPYV